MLARVYSAAVHGVEAYEVEIEVNGCPGLPAIVVVGLPDAAVKESRDRVTAAVANSGYRWPVGRTTVNLAPASLRKEGPSFDLPIALAMVAASEGLDPARLEPYAFVGELALTGAVRPVRGVLPVAVEARRRGRRALCVPAENAAEAALVEGIAVHGVRSLREVFEALRGEPGGPGDDPAVLPAPTRLDPALLGRLRAEAEGTATGADDFAEVRGQALAKRAVEVAVAGGHNLLMVGPPGSGKSMLAKRIPSILPPLGLEEVIEVTKIHSIAGLLPPGAGGAVTRPPFRAPHHSISDAGLVGGTSNPVPGEISAAHRGVLFLDELPEFRRSTLEVLRQPLEEGQVTISRASGSVTFPAAFLLVAAMNPCPCGFQGHPHRRCRCAPAQIERYRHRVSGPLLDRIDLHLEVAVPGYTLLTDPRPAESSAEIRARVLAARARQHARLAAWARSPEAAAAGSPGPPGGNGNGTGAGGGRGPARNAALTGAQVQAFCQPEAAGAELLRRALTEQHLSARAYGRILKVARTIADLDGHDGPPRAEHVAEAVQYRSLDRSLWS